MQNFRNKTIEHFINNSIKSILESVDKMIEIYDADTIGLVGMYLSIFLVLFLVFQINRIALTKDQEIFQTF